MPITNYLPSSRLIQPGVCTSSTRPASPFEGQCIFETDTDRFLHWTGSEWRIHGGQMPSLSVLAGANQTGIANNTWSFLTFPTPTVELNSGLTYSNGLVTIPAGMTGIYSVLCQIQWDSNASGFRSLQLTAQATPNVGIIANSSVNATNGSFIRTSLSGVARLVAGTTYGISVLQDSGGARGTEVSFMPNRLVLSMMSAQ
jgi:hypothetical protein